jgi:L-amino acid N-acyltransferase YncA
MNIRLASQDDAEQIRNIYAPYCSTPISFEEAPPSVDEMSRRIAAVIERYPWLVAVEDGRALGYAYAGTYRQRAAYRWSVEVSVYIAEGQHRQGLGRALYTSLFNVLRLQGFVNAYAGATLPNAGSAGLHESMGFQPVGVYHNAGFKYGTWHDVGWWQLQLQAPILAPAEPRPLSGVCDSRESSIALESGLAVIRSKRD